MSCEAKPHAQEHAWPSGPSLLSLLQPAARSRERENSIDGWLRVATDRYDNVADCTCICECSFRSGGSEYRSSEHRNSESKSKKKKSGITGQIIGDYCREVLLNLCHLDSSDRTIESCKLVDHCKRSIISVSESTKFPDFSLPTTPPPHATISHKKIVYVWITCRQHV